MQPPIPRLDGQQHGGAGGPPRPRCQPSKEEQARSRPPKHADETRADGDGNKVCGLHEYSSQARTANELFQNTVCQRLDASHDSGGKWKVRH